MDLVLTREKDVCGEGYSITYDYDMLVKHHRKRFVKRWSDTILLRQLRQLWSTVCKVFSILNYFRFKRG